VCFPEEAEMVHNSQQHKKSRQHRELSGTVAPNDNLLCSMFCEILNPQEGAPDFCKKQCTMHKDSAARLHKTNNANIHNTTVPNNNSKSPTPLTVHYFDQTVALK